MLALDRTERTAFVGSLGGEIVQLILSESSVQVLRRLGLCHSTELVAMSMLTSWGTGPSSQLTNSSQLTELERIRISECMLIASLIRYGGQRKNESGPRGRERCSRGEGGDGVVPARGPGLGCGEHQSIRRVTRERVR